MCAGSRKYPDPHHGGNWKFQGGGGGGGQKPRKFQRGGAWNNKITFLGSISFRLRTEFEHCFLPTW